MSVCVCVCVCVHACTLLPPGCGLKESKLFRQRFVLICCFQVMVKQEIYRRMGYVIQADEEQLRTQLESIQAELNAPTRFKVSAL